ncbi:hypothetical protein [Roseibium alexandrii]|uniref:Uncharacterized protein n=1 Tax=Roseibium alexandrii TaxID=388408 RepID=A0A0M6ZZU1_9HYPH|nr:hypothetical protein [Roseibium alexandrii]CTQ67064.1 hypothetical protein LAX5112_01198 [Roseibium alexandrii]
MTDKELGKTELPSGIEVEQDSIDQLFAMVIEMALGPEHADKTIDELTDEQKMTVVNVIAQISGEIEE